MRNFNGALLNSTRQVMFCEKRCQWKESSWTLCNWTSYHVLVTFSVCFFPLPSSLSFSSLSSFSFFLSWVAKTQPNHWTKRAASTRLSDSVPDCHQLDKWAVFLFFCVNTNYAKNHPKLALWSQKLAFSAAIICLKAESYFRMHWIEALFQI